LLSVLVVSLRARADVKIVFGVGIGAGASGYTLEKGHSVLGEFVSTESCLYPVRPEVGDGWWIVSQVAGLWICEEWMTQRMLGVYFTNEQIKP
jgi:hypothetical protein